MRTLLIALIVLALAVQAGAATFTLGTVVIAQDGRRHTLRVEVADTPDARFQGLMYRTRLADDAGMLFVFEDEDRWGFWMKHTLIPLSIAWVSRGWRIVDVQDMDVVPPEATVTPIYSPLQAAKYALEVNQGYFRQRGITVGAAVTYRPAP